MTTHVVLDTNVFMAANGRNTPQISEQVSLSSMCYLQGIITNNRLICLDLLHHILGEYKRNFNTFRGQPGYGDVFFKQMWDRMNDYICWVNITEIDNSWRFYNEFPDDDNLTTVDNSDKKFIATAIASSKQITIVYAADYNDWDPHKNLLTPYNILLEKIE